MKSGATLKKSSASANGGRDKWEDTKGGQPVDRAEQVLVKRSMEIGLCLKTFSIDGRSQTLLLGEKWN